jgi:hypothetical protein
MQEGIGWKEGLIIGPINRSLVLFPFVSQANHLVHQADPSFCRLNMA